MRRSMEDCLRQAELCEQMALIVDVDEHLFDGKCLMIETARIWRRLAELPPPVRPAWMLPLDSAGGGESPARTPPLNWQKAQ